MHKHSNRNTHGVPLYLRKFVYEKDMYDFFRDEVFEGKYDLDKDRKRWNGYLKELEKRRRIGGPLTK